MTTATEGKKRPLSRRQALARLGLTAALAYAAPTITRLDQARAQVPSHGCPPRHPLCGSGAFTSSRERKRSKRDKRKKRKRDKRDD